MKTFKFEEEKFNVIAEIELRNGETIKLTPIFPTPRQFIEIQKRETENGFDGIIDNLSFVFGIEKNIIAEQMTTKQIKGVYEWFLQEWGKVVKSVPPGSAGK